MKNKTKFNWECFHCKKRNLDSFDVQFDVPQFYTCDIPCSKCGHWTRIEFTFNTRPVPKPKDA